MLTKADVFRLFVRFLKQQKAFKYLRDNPLDIIKNNAYHCIVRDWANVYVSRRCPFKNRLSSEWGIFILTQNIDVMLGKPSHAKSEQIGMWGTYGYADLWKMYHMSTYSNNYTTNGDSNLFASYYDFLQF